jgi:hypothetical protein
MQPHRCDSKEKRHENKLTTAVTSNTKQYLVLVMPMGSALENSENGSKARFDLRNWAKVNPATDRYS